MAFCALIVVKEFKPSRLAAQPGGWDGSVASQAKETTIAQVLQNWQHDTTHCEIVKHRHDQQDTAPSEAVLVAKS
jgi:hypothetical protein